MTKVEANEEVSWVGGDDEDRLESTDHIRPVDTAEEGDER